MGKYLTLVIFLTFFDSSSLFSQVGGRIVDAKTKQPLVGANIYTDFGVGVSVADKKGEFMINNGELLRDADTLCFSFVGYCTKRFSVTSLLQKKNVILLQEEPFALGEVTVYGIKKSYLRLPYTQISSMPVPLYSFAMISLEKKLYLTGGDRSQIKPPMGFSLTGSGGLPSGFVYEKYSNKIYVMGGKRFSTNRKIEYLDETVEIYDIHRDTLLTDPVNPHQAASAAAFVYDDKLIVMGGSTYRVENGWQKYSDKIHMLDLKEGVWYEAGKMPLGMETNGILVRHTVFLFGGYRQRTLSDILTYDLITGLWRKRGKLWFSVGKAALARGGDKVYILENGVIQVYNLYTNEIKAYQIDLKLREGGLYCTDDKLIIVGGYSEGIDGKLGDAGVYEVRLSDFSRTELHLINRE
ncbi:carboxypeptidase-like regulatory domain-containing protein [Bacteroides fragilis]|uniref:carboxypeptidase-like regulatory domain-containing protein n=1 Tax=Bacteroides fragilis TaxID=817 RepID=UPI00313DEA13|nr:carboxypeptidase-like regulatory domain-containing protein [Bacteroides fragilis]